MRLRLLSQGLVGRLGRAFLVPSIAVLLLVVALTYLTARAELRESVEERLGVLVTVKVASLEGFIHQHRQELIHMAAIGEMVENTPGLTETPVDDVARERVRRLFETTREHHPSFREVFLLSPLGGKVLVSTDPKQEGQYRIDRPYYSTGRQRPSVQNVYPSPETEEPTLTLSTPVLDGAGRLLGVLGAHLDLVYLDREILQRTGLGQRGQVTVVDRHQVLITGRNYGRKAGEGGGISRAIEAVMEGASGTALYPDAEGVPVIGTYLWLAERELGLIVEIPQAEAFAPARRVAVVLALVGGLFLVLLVLGVHLVARRIAQPILALQEATLQVGEGQLDVVAAVPGDDEIATLARAFDSMVTQLAEDEVAQRQSAEEREALVVDLEAKNEELERFVYTVSHDLKSPLVTIKGFLGMVQQDLAEGRVERACSDLVRISTAADRMQRLLDELLHLSRVGRVMNPPEEIDLRALAEEAVQAVVASADRSRVQVAEDLPTVRGDRTRLREVLENLMTNAFKFRRPGVEPQVEMGSRPGRGTTVFFVRDNGLGVEAEYHDKIFGLFERLNQEVEGTGVGLAIVRRVLEVHGGQIWVESEGHGSGSTFCFTLPGSPQGN